MTSTNGKTEKLVQQNGTNSNGTTGTTSEVNASFLRAARAGNLEKVLEYLNQSIDINVSNSNGLNALHLASKEGHVHVVKELLEKNANVNAATKKGNTALHIASLAGQLEVVELLVKFGANVDCRSQNGFTPLYMAAQENHIEVVKFLLANNANQSLATEDGFTPLAVALQQGHEKVVAILLENDSRGKIRLPALHIAAKKNDVKAAALLLNNDPNMDLSPESGFTPLHIAAHYGNAEIAKFLITKGADVNFEARQNITPLHVATKWGKANSVNLLLDSGAKIDVKTRDGLTPLHCAARSGHDQVVELLIARQAPINAKTKNGLTALHMAAQGDHVEAARILLYHSPKLVDQTTCDFLTALHVAAHCGHVKIAKLLLDHKADVNARALNGFTPLHIACKKNRIKVIELLIKHGAFKEATTESGLTPLHVASFMGCMNVVVFLIQHGAQPNVPTIRGETPLHLAARANQTDIVRILLRHGAAVNAEAKEKQTPLHIATRLGNTDIIALLLRHGAAVDAATADGYTALHIASKEGQEEVASILFENGASLNVTTKKGFTPLHIAAKYGNIKVASLLLQRKALPDMQGKNGLTPLHVATHYNRPSVAHLLLQHGASPHIVAKNGYSALHIAAKKNQMDIATTLLEYSAKTNCESNAGFTPLHLACQEGHLDMASLLLDHSADPSAASRNGLTPLHLCAQEDKVNCAAVLVKSGAPIDPQTKAGYTPLHVACHFGQINMVKFLLQHQADVNIITKHGFTSLHCAAQQGHVLIVKLLLEHGASPDITNNNGQTPLAIAQRLGYISVIEELKLVTQTTLVSTTIKTTEEKYKVQTPETMQETFMSDSEDELGDEAMFNTADYTTYLTDEAHLHNAADESIALTPKTPKREEAAKLESVQIDNQQSPVQTTTPKTLTSPTASESFYQKQPTTPVVADKKRTSHHAGVGSVANMSMAESMDGSFYNGYDSSKHPIETDNIPVEARPKSAGFLISFMVDARGGAMKGCRHSGVRVIIPPKRASMPTRITCRFVRKEKLAVSPPLNEGEALAARVLEMGPHGCKFLGPVVLEIPHYASLRNREREIVILRSDSGEKWYEHPIIATEQAIEEALGCTLELAATAVSGQEIDAQSAHHHDDLQTAKLRITRIITNDFPKFFALISRVRHESHAVSEVGGVISSTIVPKAQAVFPEKALQKKIKISLQAMPIPPELVAKMFGNRVAVSPIVTIEPRRRKFHKAITLTIPLPKSPLKGTLNSYSHNNESFSLRLLCSITGGLAPAQWEDITGHTPLSYIDECVSFTTTVSARFWLMDCQAVSEATKMATELYREAIAVPYMARFIVYAKRHELNEARLRVYCITDDKEDKILETREQFVTVAKSKEVEVLGDRQQWLEMGGNITPVEGAKPTGEQLNMLFAAFYENRLPFTVRIRDVDNSPATGRLVFLKDAKNAPVKSDLRSPPVCTLDIQLPSYDREAIEHDELRKRNTLSRSGGAIQFTFLNGSGQLSQSGSNLTGLEFNLRLLANDLNNSERLPPFDWTRLAQRLDLTPEEIESVRVSSAGASVFQQSPSNQTHDMLVHWHNKFNNSQAFAAGDRSPVPSAGEVLLNALRDLNTDEEIIQRNISSSGQQPTSALSAENIISVEKSLAKLNLNLNEFAKKDEPTTDSSLKVKKSSLGAPYEEKDMTKESESADDFSENEDAQAKASELTGQSNLEENIITTTIIGEERIHYEPSGVVSETILDSVVEARNGDNFNQHYEDRTELTYEEPDASRNTYYDQDEYDDKQQLQNRTDLEEKPNQEQDAEYFSKVNAEYEAIKRNILAKSTLAGDYDNLQSFKQEVESFSVVNEPKASRVVNPQLACMLSPQLTSSFYDNLNEAAVLSSQPALYDNLIQPIDAAEKTSPQEPVVYKMDDLVTEEATTTAAMTKSEFDELIDKINDMQTLSRDDYPTTTSTGNLAGAGAGDTCNLSNLSSNSSINSLNRIEEFAKSVSEKFAAVDVKPDAKTSQILNDIIQQVMTAQEQVKKLDEHDQEFTWENLMAQETEKDFNWETLMTSRPLESDNLENAGLNDEPVESLIKSQDNVRLDTDLASELVGEDENEAALKKTDERAEANIYDDKHGSMSSEYYDRDQELDIEVNYKIEMGSEAVTYRRPSQLRDLDIDLDESNRMMESIEKQSPIIERELLTTEQQLENFRSRLAMSESVSAVTQSVLDSIRREYNLPEKTYDDEDEVPYSSSNDEAPDYLKEKEAEIIAGDESLLTSSSGNENEPEPIKEEAAKILDDVNQEMREKLDQIETKLREKQVQDVIEKFAKESQSQIEKIMMIQSLEEPDEVEEDAAVQVHSSDDSSKAHEDTNARKLSLSQTQLLEAASESDSAPQADELISSRKLSISQTKLIEEASESGEEAFQHLTPANRKLSISQTRLIEDEASESGEDIVKPTVDETESQLIEDASESGEDKKIPRDTLTPAIRKLSISQTRLIEEEGSESDSAVESRLITRDEQPPITLEENQMVEKTYDQFNVLSKTRQYQTFESSSSTNSELNKQDDFRKQSKGDDDDNDDDDLGGDGGCTIVPPEKSSQIIPMVETRVNAASISYSSGNVSSESITEAAVAGKVAEPSQLLSISLGIKESESRQLLLDDGKVEEEELDASVILETFESGSNQRQFLEPSSQAMDGSNEDVSITTVVERRRSSDEVESKEKPSAKKESSTEISSEAYETDEENRPPVPTIEAATLLSSSDQEEEKEAGMRSGGSSENLEVSVDLVSEETVIEKPVTKSSLYLELEPAVNKSESREPLITEQPVVEELTLEEVVEYPNDSPPLMYENSSCGASMTSCSTMSEENLIKPAASEEANMDQYFSKSLTYLESLVVPSTNSTGDLVEKSSGSELYYKPADEIDSQFGGSKGEDMNEDPSHLKRQSQSLNFGKSSVTRPASFTVRQSQEIDDFRACQQIEQEQQTPTPVENITADFFDKRITSSNEPSIDRLTSASESIKEDKNLREISNESLASYDGARSENEEIEAKAAIATALLFSSTIKSQSSDEVKSVTSIQQATKTDDEEADLNIENIPSSIQDATPRSVTRYITLRKDSHESSSEPSKEGSSFDLINDNFDRVDVDPGIDNPCFEPSHDENQEDDMDDKSSTDSVIINHEYDDTDDQNRMKIKIIQSSLPSKSIPSGGDVLVEETVEEEIMNTGINLLTETIEQGDGDESELPFERRSSDSSELRTKDGVLLDDQAFLVCTPTPSNLTPQLEKDIDSEIARLGKQSSEETAKLIVECAIEKSLIKVMEEQQRDADDEFIVDDSNRSQEKVDNQEMNKDDVDLQEYEFIKPTEAIDISKMAETIESLPEEDYVILDHEVLSDQVKLESPVDDIKPVIKDEETVFSEIEGEIQDLRQSKLNVECEDSKEVKEDTRSESIELAKEIVEKTIFNSFNILASVRPTEPDFVPETEVVEEIKGDENDEETGLDEKIETQDEIESERKSTEVEEEHTANDETEKSHEEVQQKTEEAPRDSKLRPRIPTIEIFEQESEDSEDEETPYYEKYQKEMAEAIEKEQKQESESVLLEKITEVTEPAEPKVEEKPVCEAIEIKQEEKNEVQDQIQDQIQDSQIKEHSPVVREDEHIPKFKSHVPPKIDIIQQDEPEYIEDAAKMLVNQTLATSMERLSDESKQQSPQSPQQASSIIKTPSSVSPSLSGAYSPKEVRFSSLVTTDSGTGLEQDARDEFFENFEEKLKDFELITGSSMLIDDEQQAISDQIQTDQLSNLQNLILANNREETFLKMNQTQKSEEETTSVDETIKSEARNFVDSVIEKALEKASVDEDEEKEKKKKPPSDDHQEAKSKRDDNDDDDNDSNGNDQGPSGGVRQFEPAADSSSSGAQQSTSSSSENESQYKQSDNQQNKAFMFSENLIEIDEKIKLCEGLESGSSLIDLSSEDKMVSSVEADGVEKITENPEEKLEDAIADVEKEEKSKKAEERLFQFNDNLEQLEYPKPLLTSSFIDEALPGTTFSQEDDEDRMSNKTLDLSSLTQQDLDRTLSENNTDEQIKIKSSSSTSSYFTAATSIQRPDHELAQKEYSIHTSGSSNYMTAAEDLKSERNLSTSDSFYSAYSSAPKKSSLSSHSDSQQTGAGNSSFTSLNSSYSTLNDNQTGSNISGNLTDFDSADENEFQQNASQSSQEDPSLGQFNVEMFIKNMQPLVDRSASLEDENKDSSSKSSHSTLTDDKKVQAGDFVSRTLPTEEFVAANFSDKNQKQEPEPQLLEFENKIVPQDPTVLQCIQGASSSSSSSSLSSSSSSILAKSLLLKSQPPSDANQSFDLGTEILSKTTRTGSESSSPLFGNIKNSGDNLSCTSSVIEFEKLEAQCNLEDDSSPSTSTLDIDAKPNVVRIKRPRDNMGMAELTEEVDIYGTGSLASSTTLPENLEDQLEPDLYDDEYSRNLVISHDLNTIYESQERETNSSSNEEDMNSSPKAAESLDNLDKTGENGADNQSTKSEPGSPTSRANEPPRAASVNKSQLSSRSSSSSSVKSNDSFENELKQKFKINEESFFAKKQREKEKQLSPKSLEVEPQTSSASSNQCELKSPPENRVDSGQSSMTTSFISTSQLQSPANDPVPGSNLLSDRRLPSNDSFLTTSYMSDLNQQNESQASSDGSLPRTKKSASSGRMSRTSSSASSSSSTSLSDSSHRFSTTSSIVTIINTQINPSGSQQPLSAEDLPSFKKKSPSPSPLSFVYDMGKTGPSHVPTSVSASNLSQPTPPSLQQQSQSSASTPSNSTNPKTETKSDLSSFKSHSSHHSSNCYCGKQQVDPEKTKTTSTKSLVDEATKGAQH